MMLAKIFENGRSQAVRLPKDCRFEDNEVFVHKVGDVVMLIPKTNQWDSFLQALDMFSDDFMADERKEKSQERENI